MILIFLLCCSDSASKEGTPKDAKQAESKYLVPIPEPLPGEKVESAIQHGEARASETEVLFAEQKVYSQQEQLQQIAVDIKKSRKDTDCIRVFLSDQNIAPPDWKQPQFLEYEIGGCKSIYAEAQSKGSP